MSLLLLALLVAFTVGTAMVLADSGLRMLSAFGAIASQKGLLPNGSQLAAVRRDRRARVTMRVSYARSKTALRRAAA